MSPVGELHEEMTSGRKRMEARKRWCEYKVLILSLNWLVCILLEGIGMI
jgi:hypothetical protein